MLGFYWSLFFSHLFCPLQNNKDMTSREKKAKPEKTPVVPARPSEEVV